MLTNHSFLLRIIPLFLLSLVVASCSGPLQPDLHTIYRTQSLLKARTTVIFIPGIMGTQLKEKGHENTIWPGTTLDLLLGSHFSELALPVASDDVLKKEDNLELAGLFMAAAGKDFYAPIIDTLQSSGGYRCAPSAQISAETDCVIFTWDWRKDLVAAAQNLDQLIEKLRRLKNNPNLKVDIVAHSAGGLITRYYSRFGGQDVLNADQFDITYAGGKKIRKAILIGTPNYGSISALQQSIMGIPVAWKEIFPEIIATMPSLYELLPHPDRSWMIDNYGERVERNLFIIDTWRESQWSIFDPSVQARLGKQFSNAADSKKYLNQLETFMTQGLIRGRRFHRALSFPQKDAPNKFIVLGGDCVLTPARCLIERINGRDYVRLLPQHVVNRIEGVDYAQLMLEPGDGSVTKASLLARDSLNPTDHEPGDFPIDYEFFVCDEHSSLTGNITFRDNLLNILLN